MTKTVIYDPAQGIPSLAPQTVIMWDNEHLSVHHSLSREETDITIATLAKAYHHMDADQRLVILEGHVSVTVTASPLAKAKQQEAM